MLEQLKKINSYINFRVYVFIVVFREYLIGYKFNVSYNGSNFNYLKHVLQNNLQYIKYAIFHNSKILDSNDNIIIDWKAQSFQTKENAQQYYINNYNKFDFDYNTRMDIEHRLDLNESLYHNYGHILYDLRDASYFKKERKYILNKYKVDINRILCEV